MASDKLSTLRQIPRSVWVLGFVSLLMDVSSELVHSLLPLFLVTTLGASVFIVGLIEGAAQATALMVKVFSGVLSDYLKKRKVLAVIGYSLAAITKPVFAMSSGIGLIFSAHIIDRIGKGIRGAPRDALIADITHQTIRGAAYGLRQALDTVGAFLGPLLAMGLSFGRTISVPCSGLLSFQPFWPWHCCCLEYRSQREKIVGLIPIQSSG